MRDQAIVIYCICDEITKFLGIKDDIQCQMSSAEIMTFALLSGTVFNCNYKRMKLISKYLKFFKKVLSYSRIVQRIHLIPESAWMMVFAALQVFLRNKNRKIFIVDSFPVKAYENHKSFRAKIFSEKKYHGYTASKKQYFFGIKVHMIIDEDGVPIEFSFSAASVSDIKAFRDLPLNLPEGALLLADAAYTDYSTEELLLNSQDVKLIPKRKSNSKRPHSGGEELLLQYERNRVETVFSGITHFLPRYIKAKTEKGFCLKVMISILAYMVCRFHPIA